jgi:hypothetical protein
MEPHWTTIGMFWATVIVMLVTVTATVVNYLLFRSQTDPEVIVYTKHNLKRPTLITLVIENIGKSVAHDIQFGFSEKIPKNAYGWEEIKKKDVKWMQSGPLIRGIPSLPPGGTREVNWGQYAGLKSVIGDRTILVTAKYKAKKLLSLSPMLCETESKIDIESYADTVAHDENESKKIHKELSEINKTLKQFGSQNRAILIDILEKPDAQPGH